MWQTELQDQESGRNEKELEGQQRWHARDRTVIARVEQYLNDSDNIKLEIELESPHGPEESDVDLRQILRHARR